jgi:hypothetical protein
MLMKNCWSAVGLSGEVVAFGGLTEIVGCIGDSSFFCYLEALPINSSLILFFNVLSLYVVEEIETSDCRYSCPISNFKSGFLSETLEALLVTLLFGLGY